MKITKDNIKNIPINEKEKNLLEALMIDLYDFNNNLDKINFQNNKLYIDWQDYHNNYSCERIEPCPDYYGYYTLRFENKPQEICGIEMDIELLDYTMCTLCNFIDFT